MQVAGLGRGEQALLASGDRGDARHRQRVADARGLVVRAHQHGDVARLHGAALDAGIAVARIAEQAVDGGDAGLGCEFARAAGAPGLWLALAVRSVEHTSELQSLMRISYAVFFLKKNI